MADVPTTFSVISADAPNVYIAREVYRLAERRLVVGSFAKKHQLVQRMGKTLRVVRYKRLALPTGTLTEGTPPDAVALSVENVDVSVEQWGIVVLLTDVGLITTVHPSLQVAIERTSLAMAEVLEREQCKTILAGTNVFYPGTVASRDLLAATDVVTTGTVLKATVNLRNAGAAEWEGGLFGGVMPPQVEGDIVTGDQTFKDASNFANVRRLEFGEIGVWMGVRWRRGNFLPLFKGVAAPTSAAANATKAQTGSATGSDGTWGGAHAYIAVVARDINSDYERKVSQTSADLTPNATQNIPLTTPTSTNYVYDIYSGDTATTLKLYASRVAANTLVSGGVKGPGTGGAPPVAPANAVATFVSWIFGKDAFGRVELSGMSLQSHITPAGASYSNPLAQGRKVGSKIMWKSFILDGSYMARIESGSAFPDGLPA